MVELFPLLMFIAVCLIIMMGYPVAFALGGTALFFALIGGVTGYFETIFLEFLPNRLFGGIMSNEILQSVPLFVMMGVMLEKSKVAEDLLITMSHAFGRVRAGLGLSVVIVGTLLAASTGIVGATVVTMGLISLPSMLKKGYAPSISTGVICATGTLGQIIPPSIALVLLGSVLSVSYQEAQLTMGIFSPKTVSVGDLFAGAIFPGLVLVGFYMAYLIVVAYVKPNLIPEPDTQADTVPVYKLIASILPSVLLIFSVLGSVLGGIATPTEAAAIGALGAFILALSKRTLSLAKMQEIVVSTTKITCMVFMIFVGASIFSLVFRGFGGDDAVHTLFESLPGGVFSAVLVVMIVVFFLGFILDFIEITFVVVPIVAPTLFQMGVDPIWLGIMLAINLQTSFLTPPFGFSLFYLRGVAPKSVKTQDIYKGVVPFILIQLTVLGVLALWPELATWLPEKIYGN